MGDSETVRRSALVGALLCEMLAVVAGALGFGPAATVLGIMAPVLSLVVEALVAGKARRNRQH